MRVLTGRAAAARRRPGLHRRGAAWRSTGRAGRRSRLRAPVGAGRHRTSRHGAPRDRGGRDRPGDSGGATRRCGTSVSPSAAPGPGPLPLVLLGARSRRCIAWLPARRRRRPRRADVAAVAAAAGAAPARSLRPSPSPAWKRSSASGAPSAATSTAHYEGVADALRDYLEAAEEIPARERTTQRAAVGAAAAADRGRAPPARGAGARRGGPGEVRAGAARRRAAARRIWREARALLRRWHEAARRRGGGARPMRFADPGSSAPAGRAARGSAGASGPRRRHPPAERIGFPALGFLADAPRPAPAAGALASRRRSGSRASALLVVALARPQRPHDVQEIRSGRATSWSRSTSRAA